MNRILVTALLGVWLLAALPAAAADGWVFQFFGGSALNIDTPLTIRQPGYEDIDISATYMTRPFEDSPYYAYRIARWKGGAAWELEFVHHKLHLRNTTSEVPHFEVTHGFNLLHVNRAWERPRFLYRVGAGVVIGHPESTVRGMPSSGKGGLFNAGYFLAGITGHVAAEKRFHLTRKLFASLEGKLGAAYARVPVAEGKATVPNVAFHGLFGIGYEF
ncbi:MAG: hypothetical protein AB1714_07945 [Acidobacteriota bacterium]